MRLLIDRLRRCNRGATAVEYGFLVSLIVLAIFVGVSALGGATTHLWNTWTGKFIATPS